MDPLKRLWQQGLRIVLHPGDFFSELAEKEELAGDVLRQHLVYTASIPALAIFVGDAIVGQEGVLQPAFPTLLRAALYFVLTLAHVYLAAELLVWLGSYFRLLPDFNRAFALLAYCLTPSFVAGGFQVVPALRPFSLFALYSLYLAYTYAPRVFRVPPSDRGAFGLVVLLAVVGVWAALSMAFSLVA
ncbi:MAG: YIP1 family protein [candidate division KSB1 bacterium]|nr:YIP1 family protein [candidate division KSB1 bacterium]